MVDAEELVVVLELDMLELDVVDVEVLVLDVLDVEKVEVVVAVAEDVDVDEFDVLELDVVVVVVVVVAVTVIGGGEGDGEGEGEGEGDGDPPLRLSVTSRASRETPKEAVLPSDISARLCFNIYFKTCLVRWSANTSQPHVANQTVPAPSIRYDKL